MEFLNRITKVFKDYCGILSEGSIRANFILIYELLDEILDNGYVQDTSTELLKAYVFNQPIVLDNQLKSSRFRVSDINAKTTPSTSVNKPITGTIKGITKSKTGKKDAHRNEIFVDIFEKLSLTFNNNGYILKSSIDGIIQMKSYLAGNPDLRLALNEDLIVGGRSTINMNTSYGNTNTVQVDNCNFHECARLDQFDTQRLITFTPPDGEFIIMNYRITSDFKVPFRVFPFFELVNAYKIELILKIRAEIPERNYGTNVIITIPTPKSCINATSQMSQRAIGQNTEYDNQNRKFYWRIKKFAGNSEIQLRIKLTLDKAATSAIRKEIGPITMNFEIPMYTPSGLSVKYLRIIENTRYNPYRWVRYITKSESYICRI